MRALIVVLFALSLIIPGAFADIYVPGGSAGAPTDAEYVVTTSNPTLSAERVLTGTASQVIVTPGVGLVTLSLPQSIATTSSVTFKKATLTETTANTPALLVNSTSATAAVKLQAPTAATEILEIKGLASQTGHLTAWRNSAGSALAIMDSTGTLFATALSLTNPLGQSSGGSGNVGGFDGNGGLVFSDSDISNGLDDDYLSLQWDKVGKKLAIGLFGPQSTLHVQPAAATDIVSIFQGMSSQTGNLTEWRDSASTNLVSLAPNGDLKFNVEGSSVVIKEGTNARMGNATMSGGAVFVSNTLVTASTRIFLTRRNIGSGFPGFIHAGNPDPGNGFTINSTNALDDSAVRWLLVEAQ
jgi:hypothetical protein